MLEHVGVEGITWPDPPLDSDCESKTVRTHGLHLPSSFGAWFKVGEACDQSCKAASAKWEFPKSLTVMARSGSRRLEGVSTAHDGFIGPKALRLSDCRIDNI